jgi:hypothetical protein
MGVIANSGDLVLSLFVAVVIGGSFVVLGVICWVFWRAAKRDAVERQAQGPPS